MSWSVVVPTKSDENICDFVDSLLEAHPELEDAPERIVIVDDGLSRKARKWLKEVTWVKNPKPFVFSRAINLGAQAAAPSDIVICGDDVRFVTPRLIDRLASLSSGCAAVAPKVTGVCGQPAQRAGSPNDEAEWMAFICVYIPRAAWDSVGPLDERFVGYGYDDVDWCMRAREFGQIRIDTGSRVIHEDCSTYRTNPNWQVAYQQNQKIFEEKWQGAAP